MLIEVFFRRFKTRYVYGLVNNFFALQVVFSWLLSEILPSNKILVKNWKWPLAFVFLWEFIFQSKS
jgi:hypothetical protein